MATQPFDLTVSYRATPYRLSLSPDTPLSTLQTELENLTGVPASLQKLIYKGKRANSEQDVTLAEAGIKNGMKIQMLGTTVQDLDGMKGVESEQRRREAVLRERATRPQFKVRSTGHGGSSIATFSSLSASSPQFHFHEITPLAHLPNPGRARVVLERLAADPAIGHVMHKHQFTVGVLTELAPHEHPELLGLNVNKGQAIKLRLRTDRYDGFRLYKDIRRVLCHELAHNVWGDHDNNFKELNSQLNREVSEYERSVAEGTHTLSGIPSSGIYEPASEQEAEAQSYILGGDAVSVSTNDDSPEQRRRRVLEATMNRLRKEEEELEHSCGTGRSIN
ncbi:WLM-domain-containing protein [Coprinopsis marcescibilis]|uniref:WLM-domain-containing protein n=1 Tax=Coprinopsis marcescibilis TaxID=230819 RepID=A0A5C3LA79_COPMA|nr:WLM-domain-containing protein [Coprinopsis marcescibilis]